VSKANTTSESPSFEEAFEQLETLVEALEDGSVPLRQLVTDYEKASNLLKVCQARLKDAEVRIETLRKNGDQGDTEPFALDPTP